MNLARTPELVRDLTAATDGLRASVLMAMPALPAPVASDIYMVVGDVLEVLARLEVATGLYP